MHFRSLILFSKIVPVAPTALHERVGLSVDEEQRWTSILLALYGAALLATSPVAGYIADRFDSRYWPLITGLVALGASTALLCVGTSLALWIIGRLFQGASAAIVWTVGLALMVDTVGRDGLGQAMGYIGMGMTLGIMGGPLLGGVIYGRGGYYAVFGLAFALVGVDIVLRLVMIEKKHAVRWQQQQQPPSLSKDKAATQEAADQPTSSSSDTIPEKTPDLEQHHHHTTPSTPNPPTQPTQANAITTLLSSPRMLVTLWTYFIISLVFSSFDSVLPLFVEDTFGWGQLGQGLIFIPISVPHLLDPVVGYINDRFPAIRRYLAAGALVATVPPIVAMRCVTSNSISDKVLLCALLALVGACVAALMAPVIVEASYVVQEKEARNPHIFGKGGAMALAYGILNVAFAAGTIAGPFFAGFIRESAGWATMTWALALVTGVSAVPVVLLLGGFLLQRKGSSEKMDVGGDGGGGDLGE
ncbi:MFS general substrate transporter [Aspergillus indologenus CBS 114.80]|uniref:MFS general substrate transporter n=1 Tax=Aspergillus indologenus CBS 114.80 TaxID=1450541 RepID=A0A2V5HU06_9EURO|nr:MFS general substrate transporter [Aspergillus indologenus CBS 114.80]